MEKKFTFRGKKYIWRPTKWQKAIFYAGTAAFVVFGLWSWMVLIIGTANMYGLN